MDDSEKRGKTTTFKLNTKQQNIKIKEEKTKEKETKNTNQQKNKPKMNRMEAHEKWGHQCRVILSKSANHYGVTLQGKLDTCAGCGAFKAKVKAISKTTEIAATEPGERIFIDTTGPFPKSKGGHKYWMVAVDDKTDKTWTHMAQSKKNMSTFVRNLIEYIKGKGRKIKYIRCDNAGEHQTALRELCAVHGITLEYTAPGTPQQNGRAERRIAVIWQRAMVLMVHAGLTKEAQSRFWAEAVNTSGFLQDLMCTARNNTPALELWTGEKVIKWFTKLVQFGRIGYIPKGGKLKSKLKAKGE